MTVALGLLLILEVWHQRGITASSRAEEELHNWSRCNVDANGNMPSISLVSGGRAGDRPVSEVANKFIDFRASKLDVGEVVRRETHNQ